MNRVVCYFMLFLITVCQQLPVVGQAVTDFSDISFWTGSGANQAALAIDWDGESSDDEALVWGYRWDGQATGTDMLVETLTADARLYAKLSQIAGLGTAVIGLGYDSNDDAQFEITDNSFFDARGIHLSGLDDTATSTNPADDYAEGWFLGFWHLGYATANPYDGGEYISNAFGADLIELANNSWLSLAFTPDTFSTTAFAENPVAAEMPLLADFDTDLDIDGADFLTWQRGFGTLANASLSQGDANGDMRVDQLDLRLWSSGFGHQASLNLLGSTVPEPHNVLTIFVFLIFLLGTRLNRLGRTQRRCI